MTRIAIYPGTFDPITKGHLDIIKRAAQVTDQLIVSVARNAGKNPMFTVPKRVALVEQDIATLGADYTSKISIDTFDELLVNYVERKGAAMVVRGLRAVSDFEFEFQMTAMNSRLNPDIQTVFLMASDKYQFISSRFVKEIAVLGGDVSHFVSAPVVTALQEKFGTMPK